MQSCHNFSICQISPQLKYNVLSLKRSDQFLLIVDLACSPRTSNTALMHACTSIELKTLYENKRTLQRTMRYVIITNNGRLPHTSLLQHEFRVLIRQERRYNLLRMQNATSISIMIGPVNGGLACPVIRLIIGVRAIKIRGERNYFVRHRQKLPKFLCLKICNFLADMRRAVVNEDESWQVRVCVRVFNIPSQTRTSVV